MKKTYKVLFFLCVITFALSACRLLDPGYKHIDKLVEAAQDTGVLDNLKLVQELDDHGYHSKTYDDGTMLEFTPNSAYLMFSIQLPEGYKSETVDKAIDALMKVGEFSGDSSPFKEDFTKKEKIGGQYYGYLGTTYRYRIWFPSDSNDRQLHLILYRSKSGKPIPRSNTE